MELRLRPGPHLLRSRLPEPAETAAPYPQGSFADDCRPRLEIARTTEAQGEASGTCRRNSAAVPATLYRRVRAACPYLRPATAMHPAGRQHRRKPAP